MRRRCEALPRNAGEIVVGRLCSRRLFVGRAQGIRRDEAPGEGIVFSVAEMDKAGMAYAAVRQIKTRPGGYFKSAGAC